MQILNFLPKIFQVEAQTKKKTKAPPQPPPAPSPGSQDSRDSYSNSNSNASVDHYGGYPPGAPGYNNYPPPPGAPGGPNSADGRPPSHPGIISGLFYCILWLISSILVKFCCFLNCPTGSVVFLKSSISSTVGSL